MNFCCTCLNNNNKLESLFNKDNDGITYYNKLTTSISEMDFDEIRHDKSLICDECCVTLNTVYNFRRKCLQNKIKLLKQKNSFDFNNSQSEDLNFEESKIEHNQIQSKIKGTNVESFDRDEKNKLHNIKSLKNIKKYKNNSKSSTSKGKVRQNFEKSVVKNKTKTKTIDTNVNLQNEVIEIDEAEENEDNFQDNIQNNLKNNLNSNIISQNSERESGIIIKSEIEENEETIEGFKGFEMVLVKDEIIQPEIEENEDCSDSYHNNSFQPFEPNIEIVENDETYAVGTLRKKNSPVVPNSNFENTSSSQNRLYLTENISYIKLKGRMKRRLNPEWFKCKHCDKVFDEMDQLIAHEKDYESLICYECHICKVKFEGEENSRELYSQHLQEHIASKLYFCIVCGISFNGRVSFLQHLNRGVVYKCDECRSVFAFQQELLKHAETHPMKYVCDVCKKPFNSIKIYTKHLQDHTKTPLKYKCKLCGTAMKTLITLQRHMKDHQLMMKRDEYRNKIKNDLLQRDFHRIQNDDRFQT